MPNDTLERAALSLARQLVEERHPGAPESAKDGMAHDLLRGAVDRYSAPSTKAVSE